MIALLLQRRALGLREVRVTQLSGRARIQTQIRHTPKPKEALTWDLTISQKPLQSGWCL